MRSRTAWTICLVLGLIFIYLHLTSSSNPNDETVSQLPPPIKILQNSQDSTTTTQQNITPAIPEDVVRIYIGVVTAWWNFSARLVLREIYNQFRVKNLLHPNDTVDIYFILGRPQAVDIGIPRLLEWEAEHFGDIHVLEMEENMNDGKSYEFFADLGRRFPQEKQEDRKWDYAMKVDDDTFVYLPRLLERLRSIVPRTDTYLGRGNEGDYWHMGVGYVLSWDLVLYLSANPHQEFMHWNEDQAIGEMLHAGGKGTTNFVRLGREVMDPPGEAQTAWSRELGDDVIMVHRLKDVFLFGEVVEYYFGNRTGNLLTIDGIKD